jgi:hypothetical protein
MNTERLASKGISRRGLIYKKKKKRRRSEERKGIKRRK